MKRAIRVKEILARTIIVEDAENLEEAINKVQDAYNNRKIVLSYDDYYETEIIPSDAFEAEGVVPDTRDVSYYEHF